MSPVESTPEELTEITEALLTREGGQRTPYADMSGLFADKLIAVNLALADVLKSTDAGNVGMRGIQSTHMSSRGSPGYRRSSGADSASALRRQLGHVRDLGQAAVHVEYGARDVARLIRTEEQCGVARLAADRPGAAGRPIKASATVDGLRP